MEDILQILASDHRDVQSGFEEYRRLASRAFHSKQAVAARIFAVLVRHTRMEEELFYPELETSAETADFVRSARLEHKELRRVIRELADMSADDPGWDASFRALEEMFTAHVGEEEEEVFPAAMELLDDETRDDLAAKAEELRAEIEAPPEEAPSIPPGVPRL